MSGAQKEATTTLPHGIPQEEEPSKREGLEEWMVDETEEEEKHEGQREDQRVTTAAEREGSSHTDGETHLVTDTLTYLCYMYR